MRDLSAARGASFRSALLLGAAGLALALPAAAFAQGEEEAQPATDNPDQNKQATGNEIIVTALKREQTLQDTPVAVTVATADQIERNQIRDLKDIQTIVPSLRVTQLQASTETNFIIRGFGNGANNAGIEPSVAVFVDGVYRSRTASRINDLPDIERVEILRGPQSTLFGKNASAGVISIRTQAPQFMPGGSFEATYGNYNAVVLKGYVTGPLSDTVAASVAGGYDKRDGYNKDLGTGNRTNEHNRWFVRGQLLFEPSSDLKVRLIGDYDGLDENCCGVVNLQRAPSPGATDVIELLGGHVPDYQHPFANVVYDNYDSKNNLKNWGFSGEVDYDVGPLTVTSITAYRESHTVTSQDPDFSSADLIYPISADIKLHTFTQELRANAQIGDMLNLLVGAFYIHESVDQTGQLKWGTQARPYANALISSLSGGTTDIATLEGTLGYLEGDPTKYLGTFFAQGTGNDERFTLGSDAISIYGQLDFEITNGLTLTLGGNYTHDSKDYTASIVSSDVFSMVDLVADGQTAIYQQGLSQQIGALIHPGTDATPAEIYAFATNPATAATYAFVDGQVQAYAAANASNPAVNPLLALKPLQYLPPFLAVPNSVEPGKLSNDNFSYTIRLAYDVNDDINIYASYATGYKAPSINLSRDSRPFLDDKAALEAASLTQVNQTYGTRFANSEKSAVWEAGLKSTWGSGSANIAVFYQEIKGFQSNVFTGTGFALANAGKQSTRGFEFEGQQELAPGFRVNLGVTYLDPKYDKFLISAVGDLSGMKPADIPEWTVVLGGQYDYELGNGDHIILNANYHYESNVQIADGLPGFLVRGADGSIVNAQPALDAAKPFTRTVNLLDASITYALSNGIEVSVWGRNITDDRYILSIFDSVAQPLSISGYANQPRTWGGTVRYKF